MRVYLAYAGSLLGAGGHDSVELLLHVVDKAGELACAGRGRGGDALWGQGFKALQPRAKLSFT